MLREAVKLCSQMRLLTSVLPLLQDHGRIEAESRAQAKLFSLTRCTVAQVLACFGGPLRKTKPCYSNRSAQLA